MINFCIKECCRNCPTFKPEMDTWSLKINDATHTLANIYCAHRYNCASIVDCLKETQEEEKLENEE